MWVRLHTVICGATFCVICYRILQQFYNPLSNILYKLHNPNLAGFEVDLCTFPIQLNRLSEHYPTTVMNLSLYIHPQVVYKCMCMSGDNVTSVVKRGWNIKSEASVSPSLVSMTCLQSVTQPSLRTCHEFFLAFVRLSKSPFFYTYLTPAPQ